MSKDTYIFKVKVNLRLTFGELSLQFYVFIFITTFISFYQNLLSFCAHSKKKITRFFAIVEIILCEISQLELQVNVSLNLGFSPIATTRSIKRG